MRAATGIRAWTVATWAQVTANRALQVSLGVLGVLSLVVGGLVASTMAAEDAAANTGAALTEMGNDAATAAEQVRDLGEGLDALAGRQLQGRLASAQTSLQVVTNAIADTQRRLAQFGPVTPETITAPRDLYNPADRTLQGPVRLTIPGANGAPGQTLDVRPGRTAADAQQARQQAEADAREAERLRRELVALFSQPVSYTHLTLPTICSV